MRHSLLSVLLRHGDVTACISAPCNSHKRVHFFISTNRFTLRFQPRFYSFRGCGTRQSHRLELLNLPLKPMYMRTTATFPRLPNYRGWLRREAGGSLSSARTRTGIRGCRSSIGVLWRYLKSAGGYLDALCDPVSLQLNHILANPSLIFWGLFGSFFSRKTEMVAVVRAPA